MGLAMEGEHSESPELISSELRDWVVNIGKELEQRKPRRARYRHGAVVSTIYRIPPHLLKVSRESYTPKFFSFGLFDLHERKISRLDDHRYELASVFKDIVGIRRWSRVCGKLVGNSVMTQVGLYDDLDVLPERDMEMVTNLLCLDAVFVVCFIQGRHQSLCKTCREQYPIINEVIQREPLWSRRSLVLFDIFLFQNQLPLELIRNVVDLMTVTEKSRLRRILSSKSDETVDPLHKTVVDAVEMAYSNLPGFLALRETTHKSNFSECKHLLHCLYNVVCYDPLKPPGKAPQQDEKEKTDSAPVSSTPVHDSSPFPSDTPDLRTESQGRKDLGNPSLLSRGTPTQEIIEDALPQGSGNVSFKKQAERVHFLFRNEDMARLFSPENRLGEGKRRVDERESSHSSLERIPIQQHPDNAAGTSAAATANHAASPAAGQAAAASLPATPLATTVNAPQQVGNSIASSSNSERPPSLEKESPISRFEGQATPGALIEKSLKATDGFRALTPDGHSSRRESPISRFEGQATPGALLEKSLKATDGFRALTPDGHSSRRESPISRFEGQATPAALIEKSLKATDGYRALTPDGHSSRREFFGAQGKEKIVAHRLPEPLRGPPGSHISTMRPWIASPRIFGDGSAWSLDSEPSSPRSQLSSRPASDRKSNAIVPQDIKQSNLQIALTPDPEKPDRQEPSSPGSTWGCHRSCMDAGESEDTQNRRSWSGWFPPLKCRGDSSPPRLSGSEWTPGFNCKDSSVDNARTKHRGSCSAFLCRCMLCAPSQARPSEARVRIDHIPALTQLVKVGIQVAVGTTNYISEVAFKSSRSGFQGTLYLPAFDVLQETEGLLRNLLTYEHVVEKKNDLLSYIHLMDNLIDSEEDVELLMHRGVIRANSLGSNKAVADMWKTLSSGYVMTLSPKYQDLYENISQHCSQISNVRFEEFRKLYLTRPWLVGLAVFVIVVVLLTLLATLVATVYTVVTYYHANN